MCGITGFYDPRMGKDEAQSLIARMAGSLLHRGEEVGNPFSDKQVTLGHVRLKILDVSDRGKQPMTLGTLTLVFNGEIYNYLEIRHVLENKGYVFKSDTDTEVILQAYKEWGEDCVTHFVGMWSFVLWNSETETLFCSRDRFGIKPFYYIHEGDALYFGSEYKPLRQSRLFRNEVNTNQANRGLTLAYTAFKSETYFKCIRILEPSHNLSLGPDGLRLYKYWEVPIGPKTRMSFEERKVIYSTMFTKSLELHLRSDVQLGCCLSGGLDSSSIVATIAKYYPERPLKTFHIFYHGKGPAYVDEREYVQAVLDKYPHVTSYHFTPREEEIEPTFFEVMHHADVPVHGSSYLSQYFLMRMASENGVKVLVDGQGADEYQGGYMSSFYTLFVSLLQRNRPDIAIRMFINHVSRQNMGAREAAMVFLKTALNWWYKDEVMFNYDLGSLRKYAVNGHAKGDFKLSLERFSPNAFDNWLYNMTFKTMLPSLLHYSDRNSMAFTIESRVPFLDHRLVEFMFTTDFSDKINHKAETKYLLRQSLKGILPEKVTNRRDKKGFVTPGERVWLRGPLRHFLDIDYDRIYWLDRARLKAVIDNYRNGDNSKLKLVWNIASLNQWMKKYA